MSSAISTRRIEDFVQLHTGELDRADLLIANLEFLAYADIHAPSMHVLNY